MEKRNTERESKTIFEATLDAKILSQQTSHEAFNCAFQTQCQTAFNMKNTEEIPPHKIHKFLLLSQKS